MTTVRVRRIYDPPQPDDGRRVLVDRLWPRGMSKQRAHLDAWVRDVAPSADLRRWFGHDPARWEEFERRYQVELAANPEGVRQLIDAAGTGPVTLLFAARDEKHNEALVLQRLLQKRLAQAASGKGTDTTDAHGT